MKKKIKSRVSDKIININDQAVKTFFEERAKKALPHKYNYVIYQDDHPELAIQRDEYEKKFILEKIYINDGIKILDIGCGVGRWADAFVNYNIGKYVGTDICSEFLQIAQESLDTYGGGQVCFYSVLFSGCNRKIKNIQTS